MSRRVDILVRYIQYQAMATLYGDESGSSFLSRGWQTRKVQNDLDPDNVSLMLTHPSHFLRRNSVYLTMVSTKIHQQTEHCYNTVQNISVLMDFFYALMLGQQL